MVGKNKKAMKGYIKKQRQKIDTWFEKPLILGNENLEVTTNNYTLTLILVILFVIIVILSIL